MSLFCAPLRAVSGRIGCFPVVFGFLLLGVRLSGVALLPRVVAVLVRVVEVLARVVAAQVQEGCRNGIAELLLVAGGLL